MGLIYLRLIFALTTLAKRCTREWSVYLTEIIFLNFPHSFLLKKENKNGERLCVSIWYYKITRVIYTFPTCWLLLICLNVLLCPEILVEYTVDGRSTKKKWNLHTNIMFHTFTPHSFYESECDMNERKACETHSFFCFHIFSIKCTYTGL